MAMERLKQLIGKLNEQFGENADPAQLLVTIKLIEAELVRKTASQYDTYFNAEVKSRVSVVMPTAPMYVANNNIIEENNSIDPIKNSPKESVIDSTTSPIEETIIDETNIDAESQTKQTESKFVEELIEVPESINPLIEVPTLAHQQAIKELNEIIGQNSTSSLNDRLKSDQMELGLKINSNSPVKDLKKAIGINERYTFINDLFRGDEPMFERSLKTINSFKIYAEAAYWIERELKVKLGWDEGKAITQEFYQLVKRRFQ